MTARKYTNELNDLMVEGMVSPEWLATALMGWMSEQDVKDFCTSELSDLFEEDEDTADEEPDVDELTEWADFDPDC